MSGSLYVKKEQIYGNRKYCQLLWENLDHLSGKEKGQTFPEEVTIAKLRATNVGLSTVRSLVQSFFSISEHWLELGDERSALTKQRIGLLVGWCGTDQNYLSPSRIQVSTGTVTREGASVQPRKNNLVCLRKHVFMCMHEIKHSVTESLALSLQNETKILYIRG